MLPFIIGGVTIAAVGYVVKEYCDEQGCPWDTHTSSSHSWREEETSQNGAIAKQFECNLNPHSN